jgi:DNA helicase HerA-like ATPase
MSSTSPKRQRSESASEKPCAVSVPNMEIDHQELPRVPTELLAEVEADIECVGGEPPIDPELFGAIGTTMFDLPASEDNSITVLLPQSAAQKAPSQALVRIKSRGDGRRYLGMVTAGPFAEPDVLRGDSHLLVTLNTRGGSYMPPYHGRVNVSILGEELADDTLVPPRLRPLPNSPVFVLDDKEAAKVLRTEGDLRLGLVVGYREIPLGVPSQKKDVLPRHLAIMGTTGSGKSTTVARLVQQAQRAGMAVILLDVEGEYARLHEPTDDVKMQAALQERNITREGIPSDRMTLYHLVGRESANPDHPKRCPFSLQLARLSPYAAMEILDLSDAQQERFLKAYDIAKEVLRALGVFPQKQADADERARQERIALGLDEFERGYPRLTLALLLDVIAACHANADKKGSDTPRSRGKQEENTEPITFSPQSIELSKPEGLTALRKCIHSMNPQGNVLSWGALRGRVGRLHRLKVYDTPRAKPLNYKMLLQPGMVSVVDLSDSGVSQLNNLVIADLLRGVQQAQEQAYRDHERAKKHLSGTFQEASAGARGGEKAKIVPTPARVLLIIEEAHEFLSTERIEKMNTLFEQVARIAKRGRKRWLSLAFVTQLPLHLPKALFGLVNSYILHKISDPQVVSTLQRTIGNIDPSLWSRLPSLAPGQAIVSFPHMTRPLLVAVDPSPAKLRLVE